MINFSAISNSSVLGKFLRSLLKLIPKNRSVRILQGKLKGYRWIANSSNNGYWLGTYELTKQKIFINYVKNGMIVYDIGAHVGFYTLLASHLVGPNGFIYSFEPLPRNNKFLNEHIKLNNITNVSVFNSAISDISGIKKLKTSNSFSQSFLADDGNIEVDSYKLDDLVNERTIKPPDVIKIDIEGGEYLALIGAKDLLENYHPVIFLATHSKIIHKKCCEKLLGLGYNIIPIGHSNIEESDELIAEFNN